MHVGSPLSHRYLYTSCEDTMELIEKTIGQCLREQAEKNGNHIAMEMGEWSCTFRQLDVVSDLLAVQMGSLGITRGTHVGIWSVNSPNWVFTFVALTKIGAVPILINTCYKEEEVKGLLNYSDVQVLYYGARRSSMRILLQRSERILRRYGILYISMKKRPAPG